MSGLPEGWTNTGLLEIATLLRGVTYTKGDASDSPFSGSVPVLRANNIQGEKFDFSDLVHVPRDLVADSQLIRAGDVVVATSSGSISVVGKAAQARSKIEAGFGAFCGLLRPSSEVEPRYFGHYFSSAGYRSNVSEMARGVNINNLKREHFESLQIPLAPLPEQKRIADKLDTLLARVDACREHLDRVPAILKRFRQSVLAAATSGELTREWREERKRPLKWDRASFGVTGEVTGGITKNSGRANTSSRCRYLRVANVYANNLKLDEIAEIATTPDEFARTRLQSGDVLIVEGNGSIEQIGRAALWRGEIHECAHQNHIIRWRTRGYVMPEYALHWLLSPTGRDSLIQSATSSAGLHTLSLSKIRSVPISVPPIDEQCEIVKRVEHLLASAKLMEQRFAEARACLAQTVPATLAKAFRGDLVPQDPNDEPAEALLARIAAARQTAPKGSGALPGRRGGGRHAHAD